jgi:hypothetical protein
MRYHVTPTRSGVLLALAGRYLVLFPRRDFAAMKSAGEKVVDLRLFGAAVGRVKPAVRKPKAKSPAPAEEALPGFVEPDHPPQTTTLV